MLRVDVVAHFDWLCRYITTEVNRYVNFVIKWYNIKNMLTYSLAGILTVDMLLFGDIQSNQIEIVLSLGKHDF